MVVVTNLPYGLMVVFMLGIQFFYSFCSLSKNKSEFQGVDFSCDCHIDDQSTS